MELSDTAAANSALRVAADVARREVAAEAHGMGRLADWLERGLADPQALAAGDVEITVVGSEIRARIGAFMGDTKGGPFDVAGDQAREWLCLPANPNGRPNADVLKPWINGMDLTRRPAGKWIVDFGWTMLTDEAALYEEPFRWVKEHVYPVRQENRREAYRDVYRECRRRRPQASRSSLHRTRDT